MTFHTASFPRGKAAGVRAVAMALILLLVLIPPADGAHSMRLTPQSGTSFAPGAVDHRIVVEVTNGEDQTGVIFSLKFTLREQSGAPFKFREAGSSTSWTGASGTVDASGFSINFQTGGNSPGSFPGGQARTFTLSINASSSATPGTLNIDVVGQHLPQAGVATATSSFVVTVLQPPPPKISSALTRDQDANGKIDALAITFDADMVVSTLNRTHFLVDGVAAIGLDVTADTNGNARNATIRFTEAAAVNTGRVPDLTYPAAGAARSAAGGALVVATADLVERDDVAPYVFSASTRGDGAGKINGLNLQLSEVVDASGAHVSDFVLTGCTCAAKALTGAGTAVSALTISFTAEGNTGTTPSYRYTRDQGTAVADPAGKALADRATARVALDAVRPILLSAATQDADGDGKIDGYLVTASEVIKDDTLNAAEWTVAGRTITAIATGTAGDAMFTLSFDEAADTDSGAKPELTYTPAGTLTDPAGNGLAAVGTADLTETDAAKPVLRLSSVKAGDSTITASFSELVNDGAGAALGADAFAYDNAAAGGAASITAVAHTVTEKAVTFTLNAAIAEADFNTDSVAPVPAKIVDAAGNRPVDTKRLLLPDQPILVAVKGNIGSKELTLDFSEKISGPSGAALTTASFALSPSAGSLVTGIAAVTYNPDVDLERVKVTLNQPLAATDVDGTPTTIGAAANGVFRMNTAVVASTQKKAILDTTVPIITSIETVDADKDGRLDALKVIFSEPIADGAGATTSLVAANWAIGSSIGTPASVVTGSTTLLPNAADDNVIFLVFPNTLDGSRTPHVSYTPGTIKDLATPANALAASSETAPLDKVPPKTTLTLAPAKPQGQDDWYTSAPTVTLSSNEAGTTVYKVGSAAQVTYTTSFTLPDGPDIKIIYSSTDAATNKEADQTSASIKVDSKKPGTPTKPTVSLQGGRVLVAWSQVEDETSGVKEYLIKRNNRLLPERVEAAKTSFLDTPADFGTYEYAVAAVDNAGNIGVFAPLSEGIEFDPTKVEPDAPPAVTEDEIKDTNRKLRDSLKVTRQGVSNIITWTLPTDLPGDVRGLQLWRSTSPFERVRNIVAGSDAFTAAKITDSGAPENATYLLTAYFSTEAAGGYADAEVPDDIPGFDVLGSGVGVQQEDTDEPGGRGVATWVWAALVVVLLIVVILVAWLVIRLTRRPEDEFGASEDPYAEDWADDEGEESTWIDDAPTPWPGEGGEEPTTAEVEGGAWEPGSSWQEGAAAGAAAGSSSAPAEGPHSAQCPSCQQRFQVTGRRPLIVTCPSCGTEGRLP